MLGTAACGSSSDGTSADAAVRGDAAAEADAAVIAVGTVAIPPADFDVQSAIVFAEPSSTDPRVVTYWMLGSATPGLSCDDLVEGASGWPIVDESSGIAGEPAVVVGLYPDSSLVSVAAATAAACVDGNCSVDLDNPDLYSGFLAAESCTVTPARSELASASTLTVTCAQAALGDMAPVDLTVTATICRR